MRNLRERILIVEDEAHIAEGLRFNLEAEGFQTVLVSDGNEAVEFFEDENNSVDLVVLDIMLPGIDGFAVARKLRDAKNFVPILMLTARSRPEDVLLGFEAGTDDYLPKPFDLAIFMARLKGLLRRQDWQRNFVESSVSDAQFEINGREIDFENLTLSNKDSVDNLTLMEAKLLKHLIENAARAVSRREILEEVWGLSEDTDTRAIDNFIVRLRRYLEDDPSNPKIVETVRGIGYRIRLEP